MSTIITLSALVTFEQVFVGLLTASLFWVDIVPWFGSSHGLEEFYEGLGFSFRCSLLGASAAGPPPQGSAPGSACGAQTPLWAALSILPYGAYLAGNALVSQDSGVFANVVQVR